MSFQFLSGIKVLDFSQYVPGPYATLLLADMGADVVRIEPIGGEPMRRFGPIDRDGVSAWYKLINGSKRVLEINLKTPEGKLKIESLIKNTDVILESYRPGVMNRLGLGEGRIRELNPRLVYCALSGWGQNGPYQFRAGHDLNYMALMGGLVASGSVEKPGMSFPPTADWSSGLQAALAVMGALMGRDRPGGTGKGCFIDTSISEAVIPWQMWTLTASFRPGFEISRMTSYLNGGSAFYNIYQTKDGRFMTLGAVEEKFWQEFCDTVKKPEWKKRQWEECPQESLISEVSEIIESKNMIEWEDLFKSADCCFERVYEIDEVISHPQIRSRELVKVNVDSDEPFVEVLFPAWVDGKPPQSRIPVKFPEADQVISDWGSE